MDSRIFAYFCVYVFFRVLCPIYVNFVRNEHVIVGCGGLGACLAKPGFSIFCRSSSVGFLGYDFCHMWIRNFWGVAWSICLFLWLTVWTPMHCNVVAMSGSESSDASSCFGKLPGLLEEAVSIHGGPLAVLKLCGCMWEARADWGTCRSKDLNWYELFGRESRAEEQRANRAQKHLFTMLVPASGVFWLILCRRVFPAPRKMDSERKIV